MLMKALNRFYYPTKYTSRSQVLALGVKCIFIYYQQKDKSSAVKVAEYLQGIGLDIYFNQYDAELCIQHQAKKPRKVTELICKGINNSSHMLVIVSPNTINSSWVPFEIGYGFEKADLSVLCLKGMPKGSLPEYMRTAAIIRDICDFNIKVSNILGKPQSLLEQTKQMSSYSSPANSLYEAMVPIISDPYN